jgi:hypothetical protein
LETDGFSPSDMEFQKTKEAAARETGLPCVPPMLLGTATRHTPIIKKQIVRFIG